MGERLVAGTMRVKAVAVGGNRTVTASSVQSHPAQQVLEARVLVPLVGFITLSLLSRGAAGPLAAICIALLFVLAPLAAAARVRLAEDAPLRQMRRELARTRSSDIAVRELVPTWYETLDRTTRVRGPGRDRSIPRWTTLVARGAAAVVMALLVFVLATFAIVAQSENMPRPLASTQRAEILTEFRYLRLPMDSSITPAEARLYLRSLADTQLDTTGFPSRETVAGSSIVHASRATRPYELVFDIPDGGGLRAPRRQQRDARRERARGVWQYRPHEALRISDARERDEVRPLAVGQHVARDQKRPAEQEGWAHAPRIYGAETR
jgi:hypothetical protein